jgi:EmrB/QacA subfamily drug resistance transporter
MLATALTTALPSMIKDFNVSVSTGQWLTSGYSLAMGITMPLTAFLINRFPTRKLYLTAIVVFIAGLVLCVLAPNFVVLMCGRVLQACGNGILTSMSQVIILSIFPPDKRGTAMGWYGLSVGAAPVIAPTLAGLVVDSYGWQMIFYFAIGIMLISLIFALFVFADILETSNRRFDISSFLLSVFAFGGITLGVGNISSYPFVSVQVLLLLVVGVISGIIFAYRQLHLEEPLLELRILKNKEYTLSVVGSMILYLVMMGSSIILPLYVQTIMGRSATISGIVALPGSLIMALVSPFAGKMYDKLGMKMLFIIGSSFMLISNIGMIFINMSSPLIVAAILNVIRCAAIGCLMMPFVTWGTSKIDKSSTAHATALLTSLRTISGAIGSAVFVGIMTAVGNSSKAAYGSNAQIHGLNVTFAFMSLATTALLLIAIFCVKNKKKTLK